MHHRVLAWEIESLLTDTGCAEDLPCRMKFIKCFFNSDKIQLAKFRAPNEITEVQKHRKACDNLRGHVLYNSWDKYLKVC